MCLIVFKRYLSPYYVFLISLIHFYVCYCNSQMTNIQSSIASLKNLLKHEIEFKQHLDNYITGHNHTSNVVKDFIDECYSNYDPGDDHSLHVSNPLNAFGLVKRTSYDLSNLLLNIKRCKKINTMSELKLYNKVKKLINDFTPNFPSVHDFYESCISISLVQDVYSLSINDLMSGIIRVKDNSGTKIF